MYGALKSQAAAEAVPVDYGSLPVLCNVSVDLFLGLLTRELEISAEEVLGVYPRARHAIDSDIVEQKQVWGDDGSALGDLLLREQVLLTSESHSDGIEVVAQYLLEDLGRALGVALVDRTHPIHRLSQLELFPIALIQSRRVLVQGVLDSGLSPAPPSEDGTEGVHWRGVEALRQCQHALTGVVAAAEFVGPAHQSGVRVHALLLVQGAAEGQGLFHGDWEVVNLGSNLLNPLLG